MKNSKMLYKYALTKPLKNDKLKCLMKKGTICTGPPFKSPFSRNVNQKREGIFQVVKHLFEIIKVKLLINPLERVDSKQMTPR